MPKIVQVSTDNTTFYTLPGNTGAFTNDATPIDDTIFGQNYKSSEIGLINWGITAQAFYKGFAGYSATIKKQGTSTVMTTEATSLVSGKTYRIDAAAKEIFDRTATFIVYDGGVDKTAEVLSYNYLFGQVTFKSTYTVTGAITITGKYFPTVTLGTANSFTLTQTADAIETSDFATVQANSGFRTFQAGLRTVSLDMSSFYAIGSGLRAALQARSELIIEINPDGVALSLARGFFKVSSEGQSGDVGALEDESTTFELNAPSVDYIPFGWDHNTLTTLDTSIQTILTAWLDGTSIYAKYLYDGTNGVSGAVLVTDVSLSSGLDAMNEFNATMQGSAATTEVGTG